MERRALRTLIRDLLLSLLLISPVILLYVCHYAAPPVHPGRVATGFLQSDQAFYASCVRQYTDQSGFRLTYGNPADPGPEAPAVYFQLPIFLLSLTDRVFDPEPGLLLNLFGWISAWLCVYAGILLLRSLLQGRRRRFHLLLLLMTWGGGLTVAAGSLYLALYGGPPARLFVFDPVDGWWFLNWGRNLVLPLEAFYHLLFLGMVLALFRRKYAWAVVSAFLLALSHPFTGLQANLVLVAWAVAERWFFKNRQIPGLVLAVPLLVLSLHLGYTLWFLNLFPSHRQVYDQWRLPWNLGALPALLAFFPVAVPAAFAVFSARSASYHPDRTRYRFLLAWVLVSFALAFHQLVLPAHQPLHFTRGYQWLPLFLLGCPVIAEFTARTRASATAVTILLTVLLLTDNAAWFTFQAREQWAGQPGHLSLPQREVLDYLAEVASPADLVVTDDAGSAHLLTVYTPARAAYSHWASTPGVMQCIADINAFRMSGRISPDWHYDDLYFVRDRQRQLTQAFGETLSGRFRPVMENAQFTVFVGR